MVDQSGIAVLAIMLKSVHYGHKMHTNCCALRSHLKNVGILIHKNKNDQCVRNDDVTSRA